MSVSIYVILVGSLAVIAASVGAAVCARARASSDRERYKLCRYVYKEDCICDLKVAAEIIERHYRRPWVVILKDHHLGHWGDQNVAQSCVPSTTDEDNLLRSEDSPGVYH